MRFRYSDRQMRSNAALKADLMTVSSVRASRTSSGISYIEGGIKHPSLETLVDLANLLGVTADMLLGENLEHTRLVVEVEYQQVLHDCSDQEKRFLVEAARALKEILRSDKR